jgi:hypothetical protein
MLVAPSLQSYDNQKCLQIVPNAIWGQKLLVENNCFKRTEMQTREKAETPELRVLLVRELRDL